MNEFAGNQLIIEIIYLVASALFILSLKWMSSPTTARHGVWAGELGMLLAIAGTLLHHGIVDYQWIAIALVLGTIIGIPLGRVQMTAVPQRTAMSQQYRGSAVDIVYSPESLREIFVNNIRLLKADRMIRPEQLRTDPLAEPFGPDRCPPGRPAVTVVSPTTEGEHDAPSQ